MNSFSKNGNYSSWEYWLFFHSKNLYALERCLQLFRICNISLSLYSKTFWLWNFPNVGSNRSESFWIIDKLSLQFNHSRINTLFLTLLSEIIWLGKKKKTVENRMNLKISFTGYLFIQLLFVTGISQVTEGCWWFSLPCFHLRCEIISDYRSVTQRSICGTLCLVGYSSCSYQ